MGLNSAFHAKDEWAGITASTEMTCRCCNPGLPVCLALLHCSCCTFHIRQDDKQWLSLSCCETIWYVLSRYNMYAFKFSYLTLLTHTFSTDHFLKWCLKRTGKPEAVKEEGKAEMHLDPFEITACLISFFLLFCWKWTYSTQLAAGGLRHIFQEWAI